MSFFNQPIVKTVLVVLGTIVVLKVASNFVARIPFVGQYLAL